MYALWAKNDYHHYFDKVDNTIGNSSDENPLTATKRQVKKAESEVKILSAEDFTKAQDDDDNNKEAAEGKDGSGSKSDIEQMLSDIELKRGKMRQARDQDFLDAWNSLFDQEGSLGYQVRQVGLASLPLSWALMALFKHKRF